MNTKMRKGKNSPIETPFCDLIKQIQNANDLLDLQGSTGNWNYDPYMHGMFNGMEVILATIEDREPNFKEAPEEWLCDIIVDVGDCGEATSE